MQSPTAAENSCQKCRRTLTPESKFCIHCGVSVLRSSSLSSPIRIYPEGRETIVFESRARWVPDRDVSACMRCTKKFTFLNRKHHCRHCGLVICQPCSSQKMKLKGYPQEERVCDTCFANLSFPSASSTGSSKTTVGAPPVTEPNLSVDIGPLRAREGKDSSASSSKESSPPSAKSKDKEKARTTPLSTSASTTSSILGVPHTRMSRVSPTNSDASTTSNNSTISSPGNASGNDSPMHSAHNSPRLNRASSINSSHSAHTPKRPSLNNSKQSVVPGSLSTGRSAFASVPEDRLSVPTAPVTESPTVAPAALQPVVVVSVTTSITSSTPAHPSPSGSSLPATTNPRFRVRSVSSQVGVTFSPPQPNVNGALVSGVPSPKTMPNGHRGSISAQAPSRSISIVIAGSSSRPRPSPGVNPSRFAATEEEAEEDHDDAEEEAAPAGALPENKFRNRSDSISKGSRYFKAPKLHAKNSKQSELSSQAKTLVAMNDFAAAVKLPPGENMLNWFAVHAIDFYNQISFLYGQLAPMCTTLTCPSTTAGPGVEYRWQPEDSGPALCLPAPEYFDRMMAWVKSQLDDPSVFPQPPWERGYPIDFKDRIKNIFRRLFRVYAHVYHSHYTDIAGSGAVPPPLSTPLASSSSSSSSSSASTTSSINGDISPNTSANFATLSAALRRAGASPSQSPRAVTSVGLPGGTPTAGNTYAELDVSLLERRFKHFVHFVHEFGLISSRELTPLQDLVAAIIQNPHRKTAGAALKSRTSSITASASNPLSSPVSGFALSAATSSTSTVESPDGNTPRSSLLTSQFRSSLSLSMTPSQQLADQHSQILALIRAQYAQEQAQLNTSSVQSTTSPTSASSTISSRFSSSPSSAVTTISSQSATSPSSAVSTLSSQSSTSPSATTTTISSLPSLLSSPQSSKGVVRARSRVRPQPIQPAVLPSAEKGSDSVLLSDDAVLSETRRGSPSSPSRPRPTQQLPTLPSASASISSEFTFGSSRRRSSPNAKTSPRLKV